MRRLQSIAAIALLLGAATAASAEPPEPHLITVIGHGVVHAPPDRATVTLGILVRGPALETVRADANRVTGALLAVTRELKIDDRDVRTTRISVSPEWESADAKHARRLAGYVVERQIIVELKDLDRLGELVEKGLSAGANLASEPLLDSSRRADLEREALGRAVADARLNAAAVARALDGGVGAVHRVDQGGIAPMPVQRMAMARVGEAATFQTGELAFDATVTASFQFVASGAPH